MQACSDSFSCPGGATPMDNPNVEPTANGCGPSALPLAGPSFSFLQCCEQHDFCYGTCGTSKQQCDNDFYSCMYCSCQETYDDFFSILACEEIACTYFQAVDEFGCFSFTSGQEEACTCPGKSAHERSQSKTVAVNKFGPVHPSMRKVDLICDAPFDVDDSQCGSYEGNDNGAYDYDYNEVDNEDPYTNDEDYNDDETIQNSESSASPATETSTSPISASSST